LLSYTGVRRTLNPPLKRNKLSSFTAWIKSLKIC